jgi:hypothetical protein
LMAMAVTRKLVCLPHDSLPTLRRAPTTTTDNAVLDAYSNSHDTSRRLKRFNMSLSHTRYCSSYALSHIKVGKSLSPLVSRGSIVPEIMSRSGFDHKRKRAKVRDNSRESIRISLDRITSKRQNV